MRMGGSEWESYGKPSEPVRGRERERETAFCFTGLETGSLKLWFEDVRR